MGFMLSGFLGAAHDCAHGTHLDSKAGNRWAGALWASAVLFNFSLYKYFHLEHHKHTGVDGDTEPNGRFQNVWIYLLALPTTAFFSAFWKMAFRAEREQFPSFVRTLKARREVKTDNRIQMIWAMVIILTSTIYPEEIFLSYFVPLLFYFPMVFFTSLPEHYGCDLGPDTWTNTRSTVSNPVFRYYFWNGNFHSEHHVYPSVPSCNLPVVHRRIGTRFKFVESSYIRFHLHLISDLIFRRPPVDRQPVDPSHRVNL
jgi:fatty acid desaturase